MKHLVIIGTGFAGYSLAQAFRQLDKQTKLTLVTQDDGANYPKPQLSKALSFQQTPDLLVSKTAAQMHELLDAEILTHTTVTQVRPEKNCLQLDNGKTLEYTQLVFACGAHVKQLPFEHCLHVNNLEDYRTFREVIKNKKRIAIIGAGLVGCEFANDLILSGYQTEVISIDSHLMPNILPKEIAKELQDTLLQKGVKFHLNQAISSINKTSNEISVKTDQQEVNCDIVLSAIGLSANIELAKQAGINTNDNIITNQYLETNIQNIYAIGDCVEICGISRKHISPIRVCAPVLAKTLIGEKTKLHYPALSYGIKTTCYPLAACNPANISSGEWKIEKFAEGWAALHYNDQQQADGLVLTKMKVRERMEYEKRLAPWLE